MLTGNADTYDITHICSYVCIKTKHKRGWAQPRSACEKKKLFFTLHVCTSEISRPFNSPDGPAEPIAPPGWTQIASIAEVNIPSGCVVHWRGRKDGPARPHAMVSREPRKPGRNICLHTVHTRHVQPLFQPRGGVEVVRTRARALVVRPRYAREPSWYFGPGSPVIAIGGHIYGGICRLKSPEKVAINSGRVQLGGDAGSGDVKYICM